MWPKDGGPACSLPECSQVLGVTNGRVQATYPSYVDIEALAGTVADLDRGRRIEGEHKES